MGTRNAVCPMTSPDRQLLTQLLSRINHGDSHARDELIPLVYDELRAVAKRLFSGRRPGQTLQATALVHEAFVKLFDHDGNRKSWEGRRHFFAVAATAMRQVLADYARRAGAAKRGGGSERISLSDAAVDGDSAEPGVDLVDLHRALETLDEFSPRIARVVELRFFSGMSVEDTALELGVTERSVYRDWRAGRAALRRQLLDQDEENGD